MKTIISSLIAIIAVSLSVQSFAENNKTRLNHEVDDLSHEIMLLRKSINRLSKSLTMGTKFTEVAEDEGPEIVVTEKIVYQMPDLATHDFTLQEMKTVKKRFNLIKKPNYACTVRRFNGSWAAIGKNEAQASQSAIKKCEASGEMGCDFSGNLTCSAL